MSKEFTIRTYQRGDEEGIVDLLKLTFPVWAKRQVPLDHWKWKYLDTPLGSKVIIAIKNKKIIGVANKIFLNIKIGNLIVTSQIGTDVATLPNYRGEGVYSKLINLRDQDKLEKNIKFDYGLSANPIIHRSWKKRERIRFPHPISFMVRIRDVGLHLKNRPMKNARIIRFGYSTLKILNRIRNAPMSSLKPKNDFTITEIKSFDERIDVFWDKIKDGYNFILEKNRNYLNWRYCGPRAGNNVVMQAEKDGEILGFIALELVRDGEYKEGFVTDLLALPGRLDVVDSLLRDACKYFDGLGINTVYLMTVKKHPYQGLSNRNGFIDSRKMPTIGCKITDKEVFEVLRDSSPTYIYLSYGDTL